MGHRYRNDGEPLDLRPLLFGTGLVVVCLFGILINKRPLGDIVLMVVGGLTIVGTAGYYLVQAAHRRADRADVEDATWVMYSRPLLGQSFHEVGVEKRTRHGRVLLTDPEVVKLPRGDRDAILEAEGDMTFRAAEYNERGVGD